MASVFFTTPASRVTLFVQCVCDASSLLFSQEHNMRASSIPAQCVGFWPVIEHLMENLRQIHSPSSAFQEITHHSFHSSFHPSHSNGTDFLCATNNGEIVTPNQIALVVKAKFGNT